MIYVEVYVWCILFLFGDNLFCIWWDYKYLYEIKFFSWFESWYVNYLVFLNLRGECWVMMYFVFWWWWFVNMMILLCIFMLLFVVIRL